MLKKSILKKIKVGEITRVFRKWRRPTVKAGGTLRTSVGVLAIDQMESVKREKISESDARQAGYSSRSALLDEFDRLVLIIALKLVQQHGYVFRIAAHSGWPRPYICLKTSQHILICYFTV